jgi:hypothetical protein
VHAQLGAEKDRVHELVERVLGLGGDGLGRGLESLPVLFLDICNVLLDGIHVLFNPVYLRLPNTM